MKNTSKFTPYKSHNILLWIVIVITIIQSCAYAGQHDRYAVGTAIKIRDGDTISVRVANTAETLEIRLYGVNAPEKNRFYWIETTQFLKSQILGKLIEFYIVDKDKYNRYIAKIYCKLKYINLLLVSSGLATYYKKYAKDKDLAMAEAEARRCRIGIWNKNSK